MSIVQERQYASIILRLLVDGTIDSAEQQNIIWGDLLQIADAQTKIIPGTGFLADFAKGAISSATTQGIGMALGLQKRFDWAGVASAGVSRAVGNYVSNHLPGRSDTRSALQDRRLGGVQVLDKPAGRPVSCDGQLVAVAVERHVRRMWKDVKTFLCRGKCVVRADLQILQHRHAGEHTPALG